MTGFEGLLPPGLPPATPPIVGERVLSGDESLDALMAEMST